MIAISKDENWTLTLFGHRLLELCEHYLVSFSLDNIPQLSQQDELFSVPITLDNVEICSATPYSVNNMKKYLMHEPAEGFLFYQKDSNQPVGCVWVMYKGGNELQYRIRNIDAFGFDFCVFPAYRGRGYIGAMIRTILLYLKNKGIDKLYASVRTNNRSAIRAYQKIGMRIESRKRFGRIIRLRIPYPVI